jgi:dTDP-4-dehydrorhamnose 3,5-epimerase
MFKLIETGFNGLLLVEPVVFNDDRGYFFESYNAAKFAELGISTNFVQDNESKSKYGVIRGLHYQLNPYAQTKLVRVVQGRIIDIALDLRRDSQTFGSYYAVELSDNNKRQFYIPKGFAHGFSVISEIAIVNYKCDNFYSKESERGINPLDADLNIDWQIQKSNQIISGKDINSPDFNNVDYFF